MPNGIHYTDDEWSRLESFFAPLSNTLQSFAARRNLKLTKYYHDSPSWSLTFRHPNGGVAKLDVMRRSDTHCSIHQAWWFDDYDSATRSIRHATIDDIDVATDDLGTRLDSSFADILRWPFGRWDEVHKNYDSWQKQFTKEQFEAMDDEYPMPNTTALS